MEPTSIKNLNIINLSRFLKRFKKVSFQHTYSGVG